VCHVSRNGRNIFKWRTDTMKPSTHEQELLTLLAR
jgi:hypothetical protein